MIESNKELDVRNMGCPMPLMKTKMNLKGMASGEVLHVVATDPASVEDITTLMDTTGDSMVESTVEDGEYHFYIKKM